MESVKYIPLLLFIYISFLMLAPSICHSYHCWTQRCRENHPCNIRGPRSKRDRIAIVGAGPAGIHMAHLLKSKGFKKIKIFEKSDRIGGKSYTIKYRGTPHDVGTVYLAPDYEENIVALAKEFGVGKLVNLPPASSWISNVPMSFEKYLVTETFKFLGTNDVRKAVLSVASAIKRYIHLHKSLFPPYQGELMPRPPAYVLRKIRGTFKEFLERNKLWILRPLLLASQTVQGYGQLDKIAAFYGLLWNTPKLMGSLIKRLQGNHKAGILMLSSGFQPLWEAIACEDDLDIEFNSEVISVWRGQRRGATLTIKYTDRCESEREEEYFDFVIWTPEMKLSLDKIHATKTERQLFEGTTNMFFTTSLMDSENVKRGLYPIDYWVNAIESTDDHHVWAQRDSFATLQGFLGPNYQNNSLPDGFDKKKYRTTVVYQMGKTEPDQRELRKLARNHFSALGGTNIDFLETRIWRYFPRYQSKNISKIWDILDYQGHKRMWYIGSSVIFESVKSVVEYNKLLVDSMKRPSCRKGWYGEHDD